MNRDGLTIFSDDLQSNESQNNPLKFPETKMQKHTFSRVKRNESQHLN